MSRVSDAWNRRIPITTTVPEIPVPSFDEEASGQALGVYVAEQPDLPMPIAAFTPAAFVPAAGEGADAMQARRVARTLQEGRAPGASLRTVLVTSATDGEGGGAVSFELASALAESSDRVLLIDANLLRPTLHTRCRLGSVRGLVECLTGARQPIPHVAVTPQLSVLCAGRVQPHQTVALQGDRLAAVIAECAAAFSWVVIETAPVGAAADARHVARHVDGVVFVIGARTPFGVAERAMAQLGQPVLATVLQGVGGTLALAADR